MRSANRSKLFLTTFFSVTCLFSRKKPLNASSAFLAILSALLVLHGCATVSQPSSPTVKDDGIQVHEEGVEIDPFYQVPDQDPDERAPRSAPQISSKPTSGTVLALLSQAKEQEKAGNPEKAAAVLERALRIEPRNAQLWYRLALLRLQQGQLDLARSLAAKSSALSQGDEDLQVKNRTIMEQVDLLQGR
jgi:tetratricopeptide (TPR) repeat protein